MQRFLIPIGLFVLTVLTFAPALRCDFIRTYDDCSYILDNKAVQQGLTTESLRWAFSAGYAVNWHPLSWLSHIVDVELYGMNPAGHHLTSVLIHALNSALLFLALCQLTGSRWRSALVAAIFAVHPLRVESVVWISERKDVLSGFFFMLTLWAYGRYAQEKGRESSTTCLATSPRTSCAPSACGIGRSSRRWYTATLFLFALGLMSKPMLVTLPFVLLLLDYWPLRRTVFAADLPLDAAARVPGPCFDKAAKTSYPMKPGIKYLASQTNLKLLFEKLPFLTLSLASCILTFVLQKRGGAVARLEEIPVPYRLANAVVSCLTYVRKQFAPGDLAFFYPHPRTSISMPLVLLSSLCLIATTLAILKARRRHPYLLTGWFWHLGMLLPVIGIVQVGRQALADRYTYLPSIGLLIACVWGASLALAWRPPSRRHRKPNHAAPHTTQTNLLCPLICALILAVCVVNTHHEIHWWQDDVTLYTRALAVTKDNYAAHMNLGRRLSDLGRTPEAIEHLQETLRIHPYIADAHLLLGLAWLKLGHADGALHHLEYSLQIKPNVIGSHYNLALLYQQQGRLDLAIEHYRAELKVAPENALAWVNLGNCLRQIPKAQEALRCYRQATNADPSMALARFNLGTLLLEQRQPVLAREQLQLAWQLDPDTVQIPYELGFALLAQDRPVEAIAVWQQALQRHPTATSIAQELAWLLATARQPLARNGPEAVLLASQLYKEGGSTNPIVLDILAAAYAETGQFTKAVELLNHALDAMPPLGATGDTNSSPPDLATQLRQRRELYHFGQPFRQ